ncbi:MAG: DUF167 domain-containing protein [Epsilonproteobacteria bacterium]|nr:DUF167 domain-containing protein [Campylobacterota bacterium]
MSISLEIKVVPQSGKQAIISDKSGIIKCFVKSAPTDGKANKELIKFLAKQLKISQSDVSITHGLTSRKKVLSINTDLSYEQALAKLGLEQQMRIE